MRVTIEVIVDIAFVRLLDVIVDIGFVRLLDLLPGMQLDLMRPSLVVPI